MNPTQKQELRAGMLQGACIAATVLALSAAWVVSRRAAPVNAPAVVQQTTPTQPTTPEGAVRATAHVDFGDVQAPSDVRLVAAWSVASNDTQSAPFAVIDKRRTHLYVFDARGRLQGQTPVLLGYAPGDDTVPGIGERPIDQVRPEERTTPAGRFEAASGRNLRGEDVLWVDYAAAVSMHRVLTTNASERRLERLASPTIDDNRISYGCINVPVAFFDNTLWPQLGKRRAVVYVLPEIRPLQEVFLQAAAWNARQSASLPAKGAL